MRPLLRAIALILHVAGGLVLALLLFGWCGGSVRNALTRLWSRHLLWLLGIRTRVIGLPPLTHEHGLILIANHISWLDIFLLNAIRPVRFISKAEVRAWPLLGRLVTLAGTIFIERSQRRDTARINQAMREALAQGDCLAFFPEGTTTDGSHIKPFLPPLFQSAIDTGANLQPVALRYVQSDGSPDTGPAYCDDITLAQTLKTLLPRHRTYAEIHYLPRQDSHGHTRKTLAKLTEHAISQALHLEGSIRKCEPPSGVVACNELK